MIPMPYHGQAILFGSVLMLHGGNEVFPHHAFAQQRGPSLYKT
jgi:hypothetical protein